MTERMTTSRLSGAHANPDPTRCMYCGHAEVFHAYHRDERRWSCSLLGCFCGRYRAADPAAIGEGLRGE